MYLISISIQQMIKTRQSLLLVAFLLLSVSTYNMSSQIACTGLKCLQFSHQGRMVIVFGLLFLTCIHKYLGLFGVLLFMFHQHIHQDTNLVVDKYNCSVIDNNIEMDNSLKARSKEKLYDKQNKSSKSEVTAYRGSMTSCPSNILKGNEWSILPLSLKSLANVRFT